MDDCRILPLVTKNNLIVSNQVKNALEDVIIVKVSGDALTVNTGYTVLKSSKARLDFVRRHPNK